MCYKTAGPVHVKGHVTCLYFRDKTNKPGNTWHCYMNMARENLVFCFLICLLLPCFDSQTTSAEKESWNHLKLAQFWPGTSCVLFGEKGCSVPAGTHGWTLHGLWPSNGSEEKPVYCNGSMTFNYTQIKVLRPQLNKQWPNFNKSDDPLYLWSHEWTKHGTCAYDLPVLKGELNYFNQTLQLHGTLDILGALSRSKITPNKNKLYDLTDIFLAVSGVYDKFPQIKCDEIKETYYLSEIWQCYDKTLHLIDCPEVSSDSHGNTVKMRHHHEKPELSLRFQSEKKKYFVDCPSTGGVRYVPIPVSQK